jgi:hypothetical protein
VSDRDNGDFDKRLRRERPQPRDEFVSGLAHRVTSEPTRRRTGWRIALAGGFTALLAVAFAMTGGISYAANAVHGGTTAVTDLVTGPSNAGHANNGNKSDNESTVSTTSGQSSSQSEGKTTICHIPPGNPDNPQTITIGDSAVPDHLANHPGDYVGPCSEDGGSGGDQYQEKVLICHIPPGNPENAHIISVSVNAVPAHVAHGDPVPPSLGPCS